jgi:hypothetical protein
MPGEKLAEDPQPATMTVKAKHDEAKAARRKAENAFTIGSAKWD